MDNSQFFLVTDITDDVISQITENALNASKDTGWLNQFIFDERENESDEIDAQVIEMAHNVGASTLTTNEHFPDGCKESHIVSQKIEAVNNEDTVYDVCEEPPKKIISHVCEAEEKQNVQEITLNAVITHDTNEVDPQTIEFNPVDAREEATSKIVSDVCEAEEGKVIPKTTETAHESEITETHKNDHVCEDPAKKIVSDVCEADTKKVIPHTVETANSQVDEDATVKIVLDADKDGEEENTPQTSKTAHENEITETAHKNDHVSEEPAKKIISDIGEADTYVSQEDTCEDAISKILLDAGEAQEEKVILQINETVQSVEEPVKKKVLDACEAEVNEIVSQIMETAFAAVFKKTSNEIILNACNALPEEQNVRETDVTNDNEPEPYLFSDMDTESLELESEPSFIVECIDCIGTKVDSAIHDNVEIVKSTKADSDDSIVVECIETCKNDEMIPSTKIISEPTDFIGKVGVNQIPGIDSVEQKSINGGSGIENVKSTSELTELSSNDQFYSNELLCRKGYHIQIYGKTKSVVNLHLTIDPLNNTKIHCSGIPNEMTENELMPLLEKYGQVCELWLTEVPGVVHVTYMTEKESENAIKQLNGQKVQGNTIKVEKLAQPTQLHVRPISVNASKDLLFHQFYNVSPGLHKVHVLSSKEHANENRGYCYLSYRTHELAVKAKQIICNGNYNGHKIYCDFALTQPGRPIVTTQHSVRTENTKQPFNDTRHRFETTLNDVSTMNINRSMSSDYTKYWRKLFMKNLRSGMTTTDLRAMFSIYGEVTEIDKDNNWASVKFQNPEDAMQAYQNIDKKLLGDQTVQISRFPLYDNPRQGSIGKTDHPIKPTQRFGPSANVNRHSKQENSIDSFDAINQFRTENERYVYDKNVPSPTIRPAAIDRNHNRNNISTFNNKRLDGSGVKDTPNRPNRNSDQIFFLKK